MLPVQRNNQLDSIVGQVLPLPGPISTSCNNANILTEESKWQEKERLNNRINILLCENLNLKSAIDVKDREISTLKEKLRSFEDLGSKIIELNNLYMKLKEHVVTLPDPGIFHIRPASFIPQASSVCIPVQPCYPGPIAASPVQQQQFAPWPSHTASQALTPDADASSSSVDEPVLLAIRPVCSADTVTNVGPVCSEKNNSEMNPDIVD